MTTAMRLPVYTECFLKQEVMALDTGLNSRQTDDNWNCEKKMSSIRLMKTSVMCLWFVACMFCSNREWTETAFQLSFSTGRSSSSTQTLDRRTKSGNLVRQIGYFVLPSVCCHNYSHVNLIDFLGQILTSLL